MGMKLRKPPRLKPGDRVATVSLSWGGAGDAQFLWRYQQGKQRLKEQFGLEVVEMPHTLRGGDFLYNHPEKRAQDLLVAFSDPSIRGIFACIGGEESIRMLPYIDFSVIERNPKVFMGYSDTTITHLICLKAGVASFYGPSVLAEFAENGAMHDYTAHWVERALFSGQTLGNIPAAPAWTSEYLPWLVENKERVRTLTPNRGIEVLQGCGVVRGHLLGGCIEVLEMAKGTDLWPPLESWSGAIMFLETSEDKPDPKYLEYWLRNYGSQGILGKIKGMVWGKPYGNVHYEEYKAVIGKVLGELGLSELPALYNLSFGHTAPMTVLPYGAMAEINTEEATFSILESGVF